VHPTRSVYARLSWRYPFVSSRSGRSPEVRSPSPFGTAAICALPSSIGSVSNHRNPYQTVIGVFDRTSGLEKPRDLTEWRPWALSCPRAGRQRFARARAEMSSGGPRVAVERTRTGHRQKGGRPEAALSLGRKRPRRAYTGVNPHRSNVMLRCNNCKHISTFCSLADRARRAIGRHCAARAIRRLRSSRGFLDHARAFEALHVPGDHRNEAATLRARDSRATALRLRCSLQRLVSSDSLAQPCLSVGRRIWGFRDHPQSARQVDAAPYGL
jgi:hypothetical protein